MTSGGPSRRRSGTATREGRELLRQLLREQAPDDARRELAQRVVEQLEGSGFEVDEQTRTLRQHALVPPILDRIRAFFRLELFQLGLGAHELLGGRIATGPGPTEAIFVLQPCGP